MKFIIPAFLAIVVILNLSSCVSTGTYEEMTARKDSLLTVSDSLEGIVHLKSQDILDRENQIAELKENIHKLEADLDGLNKNYEHLKSSSSTQTQDMLGSIEKLQKEVKALKDELSGKDLKIDEINDKLLSRENATQKLKDKLINALLGFKDMGLSISVKDGKVYVSLSNQLLFAVGSTKIDSKGKEALLELAKILNENPDINILVEGHTDNSPMSGAGKIKDNWELSVLRATEVVRKLTIDGGVDPTRIIASGRSEFYPISGEDTPNGKAINRRTEIILSPKLDELFNILK